MEKLVENQGQMKEWNGAWMGNRWRGDLLLRLSGATIAARVPADAAETLPGEEAGQFLPLFGSWTFSVYCYF